MTPTIVIVPGLGESGPEHWQSLWTGKFGAARVRQDDPDRPTPGTWSARLQEVIDATPGDLVLIGHSLGGRDHSTVHHGWRKMERSLVVDPETKRDVASLRELIERSRQVA